MTPEGRTRSRAKPSVIRADSTGALTHVLRALIEDGARLESSLQTSQAGREDGARVQAFERWRAACVQAVSQAFEAEAVQEVGRVLGTVPPGAAGRRTRLDQVREALELLELLEVTLQRGAHSPATTARRPAARRRERP